MVKKTASVPPPSPPVPPPPSDVKTRVSARDMRPMKFEDVIGKTANNIIKYINKTDSHFIILHGDTGTGKTTLARILAMYLQGQTSYTEETYKKYDIKEYNAATENGIDTVRKLIDEDIVYVPKYGSRVKVYIFDEAQQLTPQAQDAFLLPTEDAAKRVYFIFCTSDITKIKKTLQNRAAVFKTELLTDSEMLCLLTRAKDTVSNPIDIMPLYTVLQEYSVYAPRNILQAFDKYSAGVPANECVTYSSTGHNDKKLADAIINGNFSTVAPLLLNINKSEIFSTRMYLTNMLGLRIIVPEAKNTLALANAIRELQRDYSSDSLALLYADIRIACSHIRPTAIKQNIPTPVPAPAIPST